MPLRAVMQICTRGLERHGPSPKGWCAGCLRRMSDSGWPDVLERVAKEAWRRYKANELRDDEFYCSEAVIAGMRYGRVTPTGGIRSKEQRAAA
jgi:hypothetical protein